MLDCLSLLFVLLNKDFVDVLNLESLENVVLNLELLDFVMNDGLKSITLASLSGVVGAVELGVVEALLVDPEVSVGTSARTGLEVLMLNIIIEEAT